MRDKDRFEEMDKLLHEINAIIETRSRELRDALGQVAHISECAQIRSAFDASKELWTKEIEILEARVEEILFLDGGGKLH